jgi:S-adenosylmethionine:tRNA ribosyltransferase-isomerase
MSIRLDSRPRTRFSLPPGAEATTTPEQRGLSRDGVRLLVARRDRVEHARFRDLPDHLAPGDLVVVNTSATLPAALSAVRADRVETVLHVAGELAGGDWVIEVRRPDNTGPAAGVAPGEVLLLPGAVELRVQESYPRAGAPDSRLWRAATSPAVERLGYLAAHGRPIRYGYLTAPTTMADLQTVYADEPGSAEMPSAGRPLTDRLLTRLMMRGVAVAPLVLHTGVSSPEKHEPPVAEPYRVPEATAHLVNAVRRAGGRVVAVGTTVVRALETVASSDGRVHAGEGWTDLVIGPGHRVKVVDGLISGLHEPEASHLLMLEAVAGADLVAVAYEAAVAERYLWHEFGDSMLLLPGRAGLRTRRRGTPAVARPTPPRGGRSR